MTGAALRGGDLDKKLSYILHDLGTTRFVPVTLAICERAVALTKRYGKQVYGYTLYILLLRLSIKLKVLLPMINHSLVSS